MKLQILFTASLVLNLLLLALIVSPGRRGHTARRMTVPPARTVRAATIGANRPALLLEPKALTPWQQIETKDYRSLIANLRAVGCPEKTIRDIVVLRVSRDFQRRLMEFEEERYRRMDYWKGTPSGDWAESNRVREQLREEKNRRLEALLGGAAREFNRDLLGFPDQDDARSFVAPEKRRQLAEIDTRYNQARTEIESGQFRHMLDDEQKKQLGALEQQKRADLAALLTPAELEALDARESPAANYVRQRLPQAKSEEEFRIMVKVAQEFGLDLEKDMFGDPEVDFAEQQRKRQQTERDLAKRLKEALGEDRLAEQKRAEDEREMAEAPARMRAELAKEAAPLGIPTENLNQFTDRFMALMPEWKPKLENPDLTEEQRKQLEKQLKTVVERMAAETMGAKGSELLKKMMPDEKE